MADEAVKEDYEAAKADALTKVPWAGGIVVPDDLAYIAWGARAIFQGGRLDLLWDRQGLVCADQEVWTKDGGPTEMSERFNRLFVHHKVKTFFQEYLKNHPVYPDGTDVLNFHQPDSPFCCRMTPNGSYGYMYCAAWITKWRWDKPFIEIGED